MGAATKKFLKTFLPILLGAFLVWYLFSSATPAEREQILKNIKQADLLWVGLSILLGILSHISRAVRWNLMLEPLGYKPRLSNNFMIVLTAYLANLGIPRSGEFLRATALSTYEKVPFQKGFGTIVTERVIDLIMLMLVILLALGMQTNIIYEYLKESGSGLVIGMGILILGILGLLFGIYLVGRSSAAWADKIRGFLKGILEGVTSILKMRKKGWFLFHTLFIWVAYVGMFWIIKYTLLETVSLNLGQILVAFVAGAFAMTATNGGLGLYPYAVSKALALYGISKAGGDAFGWIMWISQTFMVVVFGAISFLVLPLWNRNR